jgi:hypothetical protein
MSQKNLYDDSVAVASFLPAAQFKTSALASGTLPASQISGAAENYLTQSAATALTLPAATDLVANVQSVLAGQGLGPFYNLGTNFSFYIRIINTNAGTLTLTAGTGNTINGPATMATNTWRDYLVTVTGAAAVTYQSVGVGTAP